MFPATNIVSVDNMKDELRIPRADDSLDDMIEQQIISACSIAEKETGVPFLDEHFVADPVTISDPELSYIEIHDYFAWHFLNPVNIVDSSDVVNAAVQKPNIEIRVNPAEGSPDYAANSGDPMVSFRHTWGRPNTNYSIYSDDEDLHHPILLFVNPNVATQYWGWIVRDTKIPFDKPVSVRWNRGIGPADPNIGAYRTIVKLLARQLFDGTLSYRYEPAVMTMIQSYRNYHPVPFVRVRSKVDRLNG